MELFGRSMVARDHSLGIDPARGQLRGSVATILTLPFPDKMPIHQLRLDSLAAILGHTCEEGGGGSDRNRGATEIAPGSRLPPIRSSHQKEMVMLQAVLVGSHPSRVRRAWASLFLALQSSALLWAVEDTEPVSYYCRTSSFTLPFRVADASRGGEVFRLEVSTDQGKTWGFVDESSRERHAFQYRAPGDGEFLFRVRGAEDSTKTPLATMEVVVDTQLPRGRVLLDTDSQGRMVADLSVEDPNLDCDSVRLEYRLAPEEAWTSVAIEGPSGEAGTLWQGEAKWDIPASTRSIWVRLTARDLAGNLLEVLRYPQLPRTAAGGSPWILASQRTRVAQRPSNGLTDPRDRLSWGADASKRAEATGALMRRSPEGPENNKAETPSQAAPAKVFAPPVNDSKEPGGAATAIMFPALPSSEAARAVSQASPAGLPPAVIPGPVGSTTIGTEAAAIPSGSPAGPSMFRLDATSPAGDAPKVFAPTERTPEGRFVFKEMVEFAPAKDSQLNPNGGAAATPWSTPGTASSMPNPVDAKGVANQPSSRVLSDRAYHVASRAFEVDYDLRAHAAVGIATVELWGTLDQGATWEKWGEDPDKKSPMEIRVLEEGLFGFRMVVVGGHGLATRRPGPGDSADVWIQVDTTRPAVRFLAAQFGTGDETGALVLRYQAEDDYLADRPIKILMGPTAEGPWVTVSADQPVRDSFLLRGDPSMPPSVYLRIEAVDRAGNVGGHTLDAPVDLEGLVPQGRIQGVRAIAPPASSP